MHASRARVNLQFGLGGLVTVVTVVLILWRKTSTFQTFQRKLTNRQWSSLVLLATTIFVITVVKMLWTHARNYFSPQYRRQNFRVIHI